MHVQVELQRTCIQSSKRNKQAQQASAAFRKHVYTNMIYCCAGSADAVCCASFFGGSADAVMNEFVAELQKSLIADLLNMVLEYVNIHILPEKSLLHFITCYNPCLHNGHYIVVARICERFTQQFRDKQVLAECRARFSNRAEYRYLLNGPVLTLKKYFIISNLPYVAAITIISAV